MGIGGSIFLIAIGAIVAFGVEYDLGWLDLDVVGWVLMLAGVTGLILTLHFWQRRRRAASVVRDEHHYYDGRPPPPDTTVREERRYYGGSSTPPPPARR